MTQKYVGPRRHYKAQPKLMPGKKCGRCGDALPGHGGILSIDDAENTAKFLCDYCWRGDWK